MVLALEEIRRFLGRPLQDPYGRAYGKVVGISANLRDEVTAVGIEVGNGEFVQCPGERLSVSGDSLVLVPSWKLESELFRKEFEIVTRRLRALDELFSVGDIQRDVYDDLRKKHEDAINQLKEKRKAIDVGLIRVAAEKKEVDSVSSYLTNLEGTSPVPVQYPVQHSPSPPPSQSAPAQPKDQVVVLHVRET